LILFDRDCFFCSFPALFLFSTGLTPFRFLFDFHWYTISVGMMSASARRLSSLSRDISHRNTTAINFVSTDYIRQRVTNSSSSSSLEQPSGVSVSKTTVSFDVAKRASPSHHPPSTTNKNSSLYLKRRHATEAEACVAADRAAIDPLKPERSKISYVQRKHGTASEEAVAADRSTIDPLK